MSDHPPTADPSSDEHGYHELERLIAEMISCHKGPVFATDADPGALWNVFIDNIPAQRQHYNCRCCRRFIETYGGLTTIHDNGHTTPLIWCDTLFIKSSRFFEVSVQHLLKWVRQAKTVGVFLSSDPVWGTPSNQTKTGTVWSHLHGHNPNIFKHPTKTAHQIMADKKEDYGTLQRGLQDYPIDAVRQAVRVLDADALDRSEKTLGIAKWLLALQEQIADVKGPKRDNIIWLAVATAPPGFCHVRSTMISTLLDDIITGLDFDTISARWAKKMHPLAYQRPQVLKAGHIEAGNKIVAQLQSAGSLERRFARLEEIAKLWELKPAETEGVKYDFTTKPFDHLKPKPPEAKPLDLPPVKLTWLRFRAEVLPNALSMELQAPSHGGYIALIGPTNALAPLLFQWPNPFCHYLYPAGSSAQQWSLVPNAWVKVNAITTNPAHWYDAPLSHHHESAIFILDGCRDTRAGVGNALFPETLRNEYREIRHAIEAYSRKAELSGRAEASACGIAMQKGQEPNLRVKVRTVDGVANYILDRWN